MKRVGSPSAQPTGAGAGAGAQATDPPADGPPPPKRTKASRACLGCRHVRILNASRLSPMCSYSLVFCLLYGHITLASSMLCWYWNLELALDAHPIAKDTMRPRYNDSRRRDAVQALHALQPALFPRRLPSASQSDCPPQYRGFVPPGPAFTTTRE